MPDLPKDLLYFASVHSSKGVYKQPKLNIDSFLELGEIPVTIINTVPTKAQEIKTAPSNQDTNENQAIEKESACTRQNTADFDSKLEEALAFLKQGLPAGVKMKVMIPYSINIIKPVDGKEDIWFECVSYDGTSLQIILNDSPKLVKYLKQGSTIKPALEKIEKFAFEE